MSVTDQQRAEWRAEAEFDGDTDYGTSNAARILALLDALDFAEAERDEARRGFVNFRGMWRDNLEYATEIEKKLARVEALAAKWIAFESPDEDEEFIAARQWHGHILDHVLRKAALADADADR